VPFQATVILSVVIPVSLACGLAYVLVRKNKPVVAVLVGLVLVAAVEVYLQASLQWAVHRCIERACASAGLGPSCQAAEFGCTEWSGVSAFMFLVIGLLDAVAFSVAAAVMIVRERRRVRSAQERSTTE
jgi:hypothetical protein